MPPQDQTPMKDTDLEHMSMNLKEGDRCVVNHGEGLMAVNFDSHVSLVEKEGACMAGEGYLTRGRHSIMDGAEVVAGQRKQLEDYHEKQGSIEALVARSRKKVVDERLLSLDKGKNNSSSDWATVEVQEAAGGTTLVVEISGSRDEIKPSSRCRSHHLLQMGYRRCRCSLELM
ncbi:hypothetical protein B296_00011419 [Ensete ventricosum]|uniref:Uncharacterized protein n=1 Tax=Ensete ventricosum TaxID=4639 RepID=A0A426ZNZ6_ENSVE|nr:hypothetical protein B296_00011419 [Ensete ventricosum]